MCQDESLNDSQSAINGPGARIVDIGTGAGFPGIPIRIACSQVSMVLVESIGKKAQFCQHVVDQLGSRMLS